MITGTVMTCLICIKSLQRTLFGMFTFQMIVPLIIQPLLVVFVSFLFPDNMFIISLTLAIVLATSIQIAKTELRSKFLYYWTVVSISYIIMVFEIIVIPMAEILGEENFFLVLFTVLSIFFLYLTTTNTSKSMYNSCSESTGSDGETGLEVVRGEDMCPACRIRIEPGNYHCSICQECVSLYDHHSYWLNCCIGGTNIHLYVAGILFGVFALVHGSLLILTTICSPDYYFGILLPENCSGACSDIETCACILSGIYSMELAGILSLKVVHHTWLISRGLSTFEWREKLRQNSLKDRSYGSQFVRNWRQFFLKFKKIHIEL